MQGPERTDGGGLEMPGVAFRNWPAALRQPIRILELTELPVSPMTDAGTVAKPQDSMYPEAQRALAAAADPIDIGDDRALDSLAVQPRQRDVGVVGPEESAGSGFEEYPRRHAGAQEEGNAVLIRDDGPIGETQASRRSEALEGSAAHCVYGAWSPGIGQQRLHGLSGRERLEVDAAPNQLQTVLRTCMFRRGSDRGVTALAVASAAVQQAGQTRSRHP